MNGTIEMTESIEEQVDRAIAKSMAEVLSGCHVQESCGGMDTLVSGIAYDSRKVEPGFLFCALAGEKADGRRFIPQALERGAVALVHEGPRLHGHCRDGGALEVTVENARLAMALMSASFYGHPSRDLLVTAITGTNGKTTTSYLLQSICGLGGLTGLIGTIRYLLAGREYEAPHTTPEAPDFQRLLHLMRSEGCRHVITEVSSHALSQYRVDGTQFAVAIFTNLTRDHLDYHKDMEQYFQAKKRLFTELLATEGTAVVNIDDPYGRRLAHDLSTSGRLFTYGMSPQAHVRALEVQGTLDGLDFTVNIGDERVPVRSNLRGYVNVYNMLAAFAAALAHGIDYAAIAEGLSQVKRVSGRLEPVECGQDFTVLVDYAHTDDALRNVLGSIKEASAGRIITVFGCGGNRDQGKRPLMGEAATSLSDFTVITSDNPRFEDPMEIIHQIQAGAGGNYTVEPDRMKAIEAAIHLARTGDVVLIAGKGHETSQSISGRDFPFDDREAARQALLLLKAEKK